MPAGLVPDVSADQTRWTGDADRGWPPCSDDLRSLVALLLGAAVTPLSVLLAIPAYENPVAGDNLVPSVLIGFGIGFVLIGCWQGWLFLTRSGEVFEPHTGGLVDCYRDERRVVRWADITELIRPYNGASSNLAKSL